MQVFRVDALPVSRWTNGAGRKADILSEDGWLIGFAWLDEHAPFSVLTGMDRTITLVDGPGFTLVVDGTPMPVLQPFVPSHFDGGASTECRVVGPSRVLNVMTNRDRLSHRVTVLEGDNTVEPGDGLLCLLVALDGPVQVGTVALQRLDAARIDTPVRLRLSPGCRAACIVLNYAR